MTDQDRLDQLTINTLRTLSIDAVEKAHSGHPGAPMGTAPIAYCLWQRFLRYDPDDPTWPNRDRFILSAGHASALLYSLIHLTGIKAVNREGKVLDEPSISLDELKRFRQVDSRTPGHPEYGLAAGVEATTGPLGQGTGNSVGMAIAARWLAAHYNRPGFELFDFRVYALCGDGDMMEGVSNEAASLAGHLRLSNLCWIYDSNRITIEGGTDLAFTEDVAGRLQAQGWNILRVADANDLPAISRALETFRAGGEKPTFIVVHTHIGYGAPKKQDTAAAHGEPLGPEEVRAAKRFYGWPEDAQFLVPDGVREHFRAGVGKRGAELHRAWLARFAEYRRQHPDLADQLERMGRGELPSGWDRDLPVFPADAKGLATRDSSNKVLNAVAKNVPWLLGGAADLGNSTKTYLTFEGAGHLQADTPGGRNLHFGVREHAMGSVVNGMTLAKLRTYGSTFLIFSDYMRPPIRLSALSELPSIWIFTHDSISLGEDGPTHQPVEQLAGLRAIPHLVLLRPADANEVTEAWRVLMQFRHEPVALVLTRQALPTIDRTKYGPAAGVAKGAYVLAEAPGGKPEVLLLGTGSEVVLCLQAHEQLKAEGVAVRVVSMPSWELFERQSKEYRDSVLPPQVTARVAVEEASPLGWAQYVGPQGAVVGMRTFGNSGPYKDVQRKFGFTPENIVTVVRAQLALARGGSLA